MTGRTQAWVDESVEVDGPGTGFYVLAATICTSAAAQPIRDALHTLVPKPRRRLHWHTEDQHTRDRLAEFIASLGLTHVVAISPAETSKQERARRKCLQRLLYELDQHGVTRTWLESRQRTQDARDLDMVEAVRGSRLISRTLNVDFARPLEEPMLWLPDAVAGMTTADERTGTPAWTGRLGPAYQRVQL